MRYQKKQNNKCLFFLGKQFFLNENNFIITSLHLHTRIKQLNKKHTKTTSYEAYLECSSQLNR
jgi:hypothetical protein